MSGADLAARLEDARRGLLDLSTRNRLLSLPKPGRSRGVILLADEDADFVLAELLAGRAFSFEAGAEAPAEPAPPTTGRARRGGRRTAKPAGIAVADAAQTAEAARRDSRLRVALPPADLARRLRDLMQDARTAREETGIAPLSLAIGTLAWRDPGTPATPRLAPLALLPVAIERSGVSQTFRLRAAGPEVQENLSLRQKLSAEFRVDLPAFDAEAYDPTRWADAVAGAIGAREGWGVDADGLAVGLFAFQKFLMWRDLDPVANPGLLDHPLIRALIGGEALAPQPILPPDADVDAEIPVERLDQVVEGDGSQTLAAEAVRRGGHVVIQGPPGTGKSQTISNIIAQAVLDGRYVLFVAEKLAALEVVQRRLGQVGLGPACLELHSEKQSKRAVLDELRATLALPGLPMPDRAPAVQRLGMLRGRLNGHARAMAAPVGDTGRPLHAVVGTLVALRAEGAKPPDFTLAAGGWDAAALHAAEDAIGELAARAAEGGPRSAWRGVATDLPPLAQERLLERLPALIRALSAGAAALAPFSAALGEPAAGPERAAALLALARAIALAPAHDRVAMAEAAWAADPTPLRAVAAATASVAAAGRDPRLKPGAWLVPGLAEARAALAEGGGIFGFLSGSQRAAKAVAAQVVAPGAEPIAALDAALAAQAADRVVQTQGAVGRGAFGTLWGDAPRMEALVAWREAHGAEAAAALAKAPPVLDAKGVAAALAAWDDLWATTALDLEAAFGAADAELARIVARLGDWAAEPESLPLWLGWRRALQAAGPPLAPLAERLADGRLAPEQALAAFHFAANESLLKAATRARSELAAFDAAAFDRLVADFAEADRARIALTRAEAAATHGAALARVRAGLSGFDLLKGEFERKRGHLAVRELLLRAAPAVQAAKPIFLMSPLSVAQLLAPPLGLAPGLGFDLLVIDEASQVEPVDAIGAIARCRQMVVVGDDKQMPPTRFFQRMTSEDEAEDDFDETGPVAAREVESILGLANARGVPNVMLRWHYRSRHESLIATSNAEFYGGNLTILPSARGRSASLGLSLVRVDGAWQPGAGVNLREAQAVAEAALRHARETPGDSLGIATFSIRQRDAILDAVEAMRRDAPETDAFFAAHPHEPFFVKNLENVQGDERDAMFISVGYARDADGNLAMRFGPLSAEGGERRLNVLITRAKKRCLVFSNLTADDVDTDRASGRGVAALKSFLRFAAEDGMAAQEGVHATAPLARVLAAEIAAAGRQPAARIGTSGLYLDVAAREGADFVLGVEADAGEWAALRSARDRERGRASALAMMGWRLHRAWSLGWLARPEAERARLRAALGAPMDTAPDAAPLADPGLAAPYAEAALEVPRDAPIPQAGFAQLGRILAEVIRVEQPVHTDAILERLRLLWGQATLEGPDRAAAQQALGLARRLEGVVEANGFWRAEDAAPITPRDRRAAAPHLRRAAMVAPDEVAAAAEALLGALPRTTEAELVAGIVRLLGLDPGAAPGIAARVAALAGAGRIRPLG
jgi:DNA polymerase III delta prime subunit